LRSKFCRLALGYGEYISKNMGGVISDFDEFDDVV
jgi:hypothetical protein